MEEMEEKKKKRTLCQINTKEQKSCNHITSLQAYSSRAPATGVWFYKWIRPNFSTLLLLLIHVSHTHWKNNNKKIKSNKQA